MQLTPTSPAQQHAEQHVETGGQKAAGRPFRLLPADAPLASLSASSFERYPPQARALAVRFLVLLRTLPLPLLPLLLREIAGFDYRFPRERERIVSQLTQLQAMRDADRDRLLSPFRSLALPASLLAIDWVANAGEYLDALTAALWSTGQMPHFRDAAKRFAEAVPDPPRAPAAMPRQALVVLDGALQGRPEFRKLRSLGVSLQIDDAAGSATVLQHVRERACAANAEYDHWYIDGATSRAATSCGGLTQVSYDALATVRASLLARARNVMTAERSGPEELRSLLAQTTPEAIGMSHADPVLAHFQLSLLTEGSGTQIFSTTFVQWAARECLRRAEPTTLLARFTPRQAQQGMNEMLSGAPVSGLDAAGSLIDAEQGALYTWINLQRLPHAATASCLVWHERSGIAVAIGPGLPPGKVSPVPQTMQQALRLLS